MRRSSCGSTGSRNRRRRVRRRSRGGNDSRNRRLRRRSCGSNGSRNRRVSRRSHGSHRSSRSGNRNRRVRRRPRCNRSRRSGNRNRRVSRRPRRRDRRSGKRNGREGGRSPLSSRSHWSRLNSGRRGSRRHRRQRERPRRSDPRRSSRHHRSRRSLRESIRRNRRGRHRDRPCCGRHRHRSGRCGRGVRHLRVDGRGRRGLQLERGPRQRLLRDRPRVDSPGRQLEHLVRRSQLELLLLRRRRKLREGHHRHLHMALHVLHRHLHLARRRGIRERERALWREARTALRGQQLPNRAEDLRSGEVLLQDRQEPGGGAHVHTAPGFDLQFLTGVLEELFDDGVEPGHGFARCSTRATTPPSPRRGSVLPPTPPGHSKITDRLIPECLLAPSLKSERSLLSATQCARPVRAPRRAGGCAGSPARW